MPTRTHARPHTLRSVRPSSCSRDSVNEYAVFLGEENFTFMPYMPYMPLHALHALTCLTHLIHTLLIDTSQIVPTRRRVPL